MRVSRFLEEMGQLFANQVKENIKQQTVHDYWEQQDRLDNLVIAARAEYQALRQQAGAPTLMALLPISPIHNYARNWIKK